MGFFSKLFGKNDETPASGADIGLKGEQIKHIVETLAYEEPDVIAPILFGNDSLTHLQRTIPLRLLEQLHAPNREMAISVEVAGYQGPFWMLILNVPWLHSDRAGSFHPLLLAHQGTTPKVAGFVLPWNEITPMFSEDQLTGAHRLAAWWAIWLKEKQEP
jgi:hypothetical protein